MREKSFLGPVGSSWVRKILLLRK